MSFKSLARTCAALLLPSAYARADAKRAGGFDVLKARAELQLAGGPHAEMQTKANEAAPKYQKLFDEAEELER
jgi:hypothetical protein